MLNLKSRIRHRLSDLIFRYFFPREPTVEWLVGLFDAQREDVAFLQVGSNDGIQGDPTARFKLREGWRGVFVEPGTTAFSALCRNFPEDRFVKLNCAVGPVDGSRELFALNFSESRWATGLSSFHRENLLAHFRNGHIQAKAAAEGVVIPAGANPEDYLSATRVETITIRTLQARSRFPSFDAVFIDVEGFDHEVIRQLNLHDDRLRFLLYENKHMSAADLLAVRRLLREHRFRIFDCGANSVAMRQTWVPLTWSI